MAQTSDEQLFLSNLIGYTGSITFSSDANLIYYWALLEGVAGPDGDFSEVDFYYEDFFVGESGSEPVVIPWIPVYFYRLNWKDKGGSPMERRFQLEVIEIKESSA